MRKVLILFGFVVITTAILFGSFGGQKGDQIANSVERTGYFKGPKNDRIMAFYSEQELAEDEVREIVARQTLTTGALFRAVFYSGADEPLRDGLTLAPSLQIAMQVTAEYDYFDWLVMVNPAGELSVQKRD